MTSEHALSPEQIEEFVERGYLLLRGCFSRHEAAALVRSTLDDRAPEPRLTMREPTGSAPAPKGLDLRDPASWGFMRLDVETRRGVPIETFAPRLWGAITSLVGPGRDVTRTRMGEQWILNGNLAPGPRPPLDLSYYRSLEWHIDAPSERATLDRRIDALVLLVLWNDVEPGGGGPLFSGQSLDHVVRALEGEPIDTRGHGWAAPLIARCTDVGELAGEAGDVIVAHALVLHAAHRNYGGKLRILENPTITVAEPLDYHTDNVHPSPVERAVIRRLSRPRPSRDRASYAAARGLVDLHADYFLPDRTAWNARLDPAQRSLVHALDVHLTRSWVDRVLATLHAAHPDPFDVALACVTTVRELVVNQRVVHANLPEAITDRDFASTTWARLVRGFVSCEGQNHVLGLLLAPLFDRVRPFEAIDPATGRSAHLLVHVESPEGWFFADAWGANPVFHVRSRGGLPHPRTPELATLDASGPVRRHGLYPRALYEHGRPIELPFVLPETTEVELERFAASGDPPSSAWHAYLRVRLRHVFDGPARLGSAYDELLSAHRLGGTTKAVVEAFVERVRGGREIDALAALLEGGGDRSRDTGSELGRAIALYARAAAGEWGSVLARDGDTSPWIAPLVAGISGDVAALRSAAREEPRDGAISILRAATFDALGFGDAALACYRASLPGLGRRASAHVYLEAAEIERASGRFEDAIAWVRRALLASPPDDSLLVRACEKLRRSGAFDDALAALSERCLRPRVPPPIAIARIELLAWAGRAREARDALEQLGDDSLLRPRAVLASLEKRWDDAEALFARILAQAPSDREACAWMAEIAIRRADLDGARRWLEESRGVAQSAVHITLGAALRDADTIEDDRELIALLEHLGEPFDRWRGSAERVRASALALLDSFGGNRTDEPTRIGRAGALEPIRLPPHDPVLSGRNASAELLARIRTAAPDELDARFDALAAELPSSPHPLCYWGELDLWLGRYEDAIEKFARALERGQTRWGYVGAAAALVMLGRYDEADARFAECARRFDAVAGATTLVYAGEACRRRGDLDGARAHLEEAVRVKPGRAGAWMNLALVHTASGRIDEAQRIFTTLERRLPRLFWDASRELTGTSVWPAPADRMVDLFEHALRMMRGNRSSRIVTYLDDTGAFRVMPDAERVRATLARHARLVARELRAHSARTRR